jgi:flagellar biosynthesis/type III secretory pathway protein FliH
LHWKLNEAIDRFEEEMHMPYISSTERRMMERGLQQGIQQGTQQGTHQGALQMAREALLEILGARFGMVSPAAATAIHSSDNLTRLKSLLRHAATASSPEEFEQVLANIAPA